MAASEKEWEGASICCQSYGQEKSDKEKSKTGFEDGRVLSTRGPLCGSNEEGGT